MLDDEIPPVGEILPVRIRENGDVDNETVNLRSDAGDEIVWKSLGGDFTIRFGKSSPFREDTFDVPAGGKKFSGPLRQDAHGAFNYEISSISLAKSADPTLIVKP